MDLLRTLGLRSKDLFDVLADVELWAAVRYRILEGVSPVFTEWYFAGVRGGIRYIRKGRKASAEEEFLEVVQHPEFSARSAMFITAYTDEWWTTLERTTRSRLFDTLVTSRDEGWRFERTLKEVEKLFGRERALVIAATETTRLFGAGAQATYQVYGVQEWDWRTVEDRFVCSTCDALSDNGPYPMEQAFAPAHPNCRCWLVPHEKTQGKTFRPALIPLVRAA